MKKWFAALSLRLDAFSQSGKNTFLPSLSHVVELSYKSFPTGQKSLEFRFTWHRGSSFLWNIWREWPSVVKYWPHQRSTNYFFQLRWKFTWNIRIGFKKFFLSVFSLCLVLKKQKGMKTKSKKRKEKKQLEPCVSQKVLKKPFFSRMVKLCFFFLRHKLSGYFILFQCSALTLRPSPPPTSDKSVKNLKTEKNKKVTIFQK